MQFLPAIGKIPSIVFVFNPFGYFTVVYLSLMFSESSSISLIMWKKRKVRCFDSCDSFARMIVLPAPCLVPKIVLLIRMLCSGY